MAVDLTYTAADMQVLEGLEPVRKRPGMYIGSTDGRGLQHTLFEIVDNAVDEAIDGHCHTIDIHLHADRSLEVIDDGRGIPTDYNPRAGMSGVEIAYTQLHGGGKFGGSGYGASGGLHGVGASVVNALAKKLVVTVDRDGRRHQIAFRRGKPGIWDAADTAPDDPTFTTADGLRDLGQAPNASTGTRVRWWPDSQVFATDAAVDLDRTLERAQQTAFLVPGLALNVHDHREGANDTHRFHYDGGITDFLEHLADGEPLCEPLVFTGGDRYSEPDPTFDGPEADAPQVQRHMDVEVALTWVNAFDTDLRSFVNIIATPGGGTHVTGFTRALVKSIRDAAADTRGLKVAGDGVTKDDVLEGLRVIVLVRIHEPEFEGQTKEILGSPAATKIVQSCVASQLERWLTDRQTKPAGRKILDKVARASITREQMRHARQTRQRKNALEAASNLPAKLADCRSSDLETTELLIVEGDSAGGTVKAARDAEIQALLPLRGKLLNVQKVRSEKRMLDNAECAAIISALGAGSGKTFDLDARRYGRLVLLTDADVDGSHIRTLVLTLLWRYARRLVESGRVFSAVPPLYRVAVKGEKEFHYTFTEDEQATLVAKLAKARKEIKETQRFKGLGEMDADQMALVLEAGRTVRQLTVDDAAEAEHMFDLLMGADVASRREFIVANALSIDPKRIDV